MNKKQKMLKKTAKRAKARHNKHTPPTVKKYISKGDRAKMLAQEQAEAAAKANAAEKAAKSEDEQDVTAESVEQEEAPAQQG
ncbi:MULTISPECIES: DUF2986 domain-containing protein [Shewanella]|uniref:DUF2986 domain-containing protein n=1 Tax=Shewanella TaxID=22 RepID=UPI001EFE6404|nr:MULTISPECIES: DUF2986 domain-containing protein [Shewanella]MCG9746014.1 DUF2986 domain-containing protein [Shewanella sp. Isolate8]MCL2910116.1 DUF2986 domain-containing protein [Shewanella aquimarina]